MLKQRELNIYIEHTRASLYLSAFHHTHDNPEGWRKGSVADRAPFGGRMVCGGVGRIRYIVQQHYLLALCHVAIGFLRLSFLIC